ncbi:acyl-CoA carboxylase subunit epsilon [Actinomycetes bacterium KLBMP 9797]
MSESKPLFRVIRGAPNAEELAALVGAILTRGQSTVTESNPVSWWGRAARPGGGSWGHATRWNRLTS